MTLTTPAGRPFHILPSLADRTLLHRNYYLDLSNLKFRCPGIDCLAPCEFNSSDAICVTAMLNFLRPTLAEHYPEALI